MGKRGFDCPLEKYHVQPAGDGTRGGKPERRDWEQPLHMNTLQELETYLEEECYSFLNLTIGKHRAYEGIILEKSSSGWCFSYSERGRTEVIHTFDTEAELVHFVLQELRGDPWAKAHLAAWCWSEEEIRQAERELEDRGIPFRRNDVPNYNVGRRAYRIYVFGRDILDLKDFRQKYWRR